VLGDSETQQHHGDDYIKYLSKTKPVAVGDQDSESVSLTPHATSPKLWYTNVILGFHLETFGKYRFASYSTPSSL